MGFKEKALDTVEIVAKTALSVIPVGGALATSVYDTVKGNCLSKRQEKWKDALEERLSKLETTLEDIGNNEFFTTALVKATELAMKTSREEKMAYLANSVVNSLTPDIDEEKLIVFLSLLDKYTISHIKIIYFFNNPKRFDGISSSSYMMGSPTTPLFQIYPELNNGLFKKIYDDLYTDGMVTTESLNVTMTGSGMVAKRTTPLCDEFLKFILDSDNNVD
jgi:hypothetical protein